MKLAIHRFPDPILKRETRPVVRIDTHLSNLIEAMIRMMRKQPRCVGIAAPQVGYSLRLAVMDSSAHPKSNAGHGLLVLVNPRLSLMEGESIQREGCLSVPAFTGNVQRAKKVKLAAADAEGRPYEIWLNGFEAIVAQHEVDHLDGKLFLDRVASRKDIYPRKK